MGHTYADLRRVEGKIQELNELCKQCQTLSKTLQGELSGTEDALKSVNALIQGHDFWTGADADSCADAVNRLRESIVRSRDQLCEGMNKLCNALMDEVHRQQTVHNRIYRELSTVEVIVGRALD